MPRTQPRWVILALLSASACSQGCHSSPGVADAAKRAVGDASVRPKGAVDAGAAGMAGASAPHTAGTDAGAAGRGAGPDAGAHPTVDASAAKDAAVGSDAGGAGIDRPGWKLVWHDEFDGAAGKSPDAASWVFETGGTGWGNNELEFYTARPENAALDGQGVLIITARKESYMGKSYTSARMKTQGKLEQSYGRFEARIRIPKGQGIWPAFWMLGNDIGSASWPACGEIDIMENIGREPTTVHGTIHGPGYSGGSALGAPYKLAKGAFADDYHVFAVEWQADAVRWYVDDMLYETRTPADLPANARWVYDHSFFILLNVAVGGQWPGNPDATSTFPQEMRVDYVRVYTPSK